MATTSRAWAALIGVLVAGTTLVSPAAADTTGPARQGLARGRIVDAEGRAASGALVSIYAEPVETADHHFNVGDSGTLPVVAQVSTDARGRYALAVNRAELDRYRDSQGNVNLRLVAHDTKGDIANISFGLTPLEAQTEEGRGRAAAVGLAASPLTPVDVADLALVTGQQTVARNSTPRRKAQAKGWRMGGDPATEAGDPGVVEPMKWTQQISRGDAFVDGVGSSQVALSPQIVVCSWVLLSNLGPKSVWVGGTYVKATGVTADLQYSYGASSSLGVGISSTGGYGSYSASGTRTVSATGSIDYPTNYGFQHDYTQFVYGKYGYSCDTTPGYKQYEVRARYWAGGATTYAPSVAPSAPYCLPYQAGVTFTKQTTAAYAFSTGADTSGSIGIDLSSQTGYSSALKIVFRFTANRHLCGTNDLPGGNPRRLVAQV